MSRLAAIVALCASQVGCAKLLGLEPTTFDQLDAHLDAPGVCDGAPLCTVTTGRSVCGQLVGTGDTAGMPFRVAAPTGMDCATLGSSEGPCGYTVGALPLSAFLADMTTTLVAGKLDDCGRYAIPDLDPALADVAIVLDTSGTTLRRSARVVTGRSSTPDEIDSGIDALAVAQTTVDTWGTQLSGGVGTPIDTGTSFLLRYTNSNVSLAGVVVTKDGSSALPAPPTPPWAAYFGDQPFDALMMTGPMATGASGTAISVLGAGSFSLEGFRSGHQRCKIAGLQHVANTLIYVVETDC